MVKRTVILPLRDNDGRRLTAELEYCERELLATAGGFTVTASRGAWLGDDGRIYRDRGRLYQAVMDPAAEVEFVALLPTWCARLRQRAIYSERADVQVEFIS